MMRTRTNFRPPILFAADLKFKLEAWKTTTTNFSFCFNEYTHILIQFNAVLFVCACENPLHSVMYAQTPSMRILSIISWIYVTYEIVTRSNTCKYVWSELHIDRRHISMSCEKKEKKNIAAQIKSFCCLQYHSKIYSMTTRKMEMRQKKTFASHTA